MSVLLITGPPASGKNTVAECLGKRMYNCAVVDVDDVRHMIVQPIVDPWQQEEGARQRAIGVLNACAMARNFESQGFDTVLVDLLTDETAKMYRSALGDLNFFVLSLLPTEQEINSRLLTRTDYLARGDTDWMYAQQAAFSDYDERLDNTLITPDEAATWILERWTPSF